MKRGSAASPGLLLTAALPMLDFAGCGAVHLLGGMASLVGAWMVGPRPGAFGLRWPSWAANPPPQPPSRKTPNCIFWRNFSSAVGGFNIWSEVSIHLKASFFLQYATFLELWEQNVQTGRLWVTFFAHPQPNKILWDSIALFSICHLYHCPR